MAKRVRALVLGGGGARGALQVGALRALLEAGYHPDLVVGTSIGAANAAFLGLRGFDRAGLAVLESAWHDAATADLLPANYLWLTVRSLFGRGSGHLQEQMRLFLSEHGITPELRFGQLHGPSVRLAVADLNSSRLLLFGADPDGSVLEGVLASAALPPWLRPLETNGRLLLDGGTLSNLPIEPALEQGATEIIGLDISDPRGLPADVPAFGPVFVKLVNTMQQRQLKLELALAAARNVSVRLLPLRYRHAAPIWDFRHTDELIAAGYAFARMEIAGWCISQRDGGIAKRDRLT